MTRNEENLIIKQAVEIIDKRYRNFNETFDRPEIVASALALKLTSLKTEVFGALFLNTKNQLIKDLILSRGTIDCTTVHVRTVAEKALRLKAKSMVVYHNHPSGNVNPSPEDTALTRKLKEGLAVLEIKLLDHLIVFGRDYYSFADNGGI